jgi:hypothetical protein
MLLFVATYGLCGCLGIVISLSRPLAPEGRRAFAEKPLNWRQLHCVGYYVQLIYSLDALLTLESEGANIVTP